LEDLEEEVETREEKDYFFSHFLLYERRKKNLYQVRKICENVCERVYEMCPPFEIRKLGRIMAFDFKLPKQK